MKKNENNNTSDNFCFIILNYSTILKIEENKTNK